MTFPKISRITSLKVFQAAGTMLKNISLMLGIAALYILSAQIGTALRPFSLHTMLIWPPSGIALAAVMLFGRRSLPGIVVGAFITTLLVELGLIRIDALAFQDVPVVSMLSAALIVAAASTTAVWVAAQVLTFIAPAAPLWSTSAEVVSGTFALALACLVYATGTTGILYICGLLPTDLTIDTLSLWCVSSFLGMIVFAPLTYVIARYWVKPHNNGNTSDDIGPTVFYSLFATFSFIVFLGLWDSETTRILRSLTQKSALAAEHYSQLLKTAKHDLEGIEAFFSASEHISADEFRRYVAVEVGEKNGGPVALGVGWVPRVTDVNGWNAQFRNQSGTYLYELDASGRHVPVTPRAEYFPVQFIRPLNAATQTAIGFDLGSDKFRRALLESARDSGNLQLVVTPMVLVPSLSAEPAMQISVAVYRSDEPSDTITARRANLAGFASGVYMIRPMFDRAIDKNDTNVDLHLFDITESGTANWQHTAFSPKRNATDIVTTTPAPSLAQLLTLFNGLTKVNFAGHQWLIIATPGPGYITENRSYIPWGALLLLQLLGIVLTCILIERLCAVKLINAERLKTEQALLKAQAANNSKAFLMAAASHDIKQPLLALGILADTLLMSNPPEATVPLVKGLRNSIDQMSVHFDTLMDADKFRDGSFAVTPTTFRLGQFSLRLDLEIAPLCAQKGLSWNLEMDDVLVRTDQELLLRLFRNLLTNAVKYTASGGVSCTAKASADCVQFLISDTGTGIAADRQASLFDVFRRLEKEGVGFAGSGLGLAIVAKISASLNLGLQMSSDEIQGTVFRFQLPREQT